MLSQRNINVANNTPTSTPKNVSIVKQSQKSVKHIDFDVNDCEENNLAFQNKKPEKDQEKLKNSKVITKENNNKSKQNKEVKTLNPDPDMRFTYTGMGKPDLYEDTFIRMLEKQSVESLEDDWPHSAEVNVFDNFNIFEGMDDENNFMAPI